MVFLANLGIHLHVCLCGDLKVASAQALDCLDIGQTGTRHEAVGLSTRRVWGLFARVRCRSAASPPACFAASRWYTGSLAAGAQRGEATESRSLGAGALPARGTW